MADNSLNQTSKSDHCPDQEKKTLVIRVTFAQLQRWVELLDLGDVIADSLKYLKPTFGENPTQAFAHQRYVKKWFEESIRLRKMLENNLDTI